MAAELALRTYLARNARDLICERGQLVDHRVDRVRQRRDLPLRLHRDLLRQIALRHCRRDLRDVAHLVGQVRGHEVDGVGEVLPGARHTAHVCLTAELALGPDLARDTRHLIRERGQLVHHRVNGRADSQELTLDRLPLDLERHLLRQIALGDGHDHARHLRSRPHEIVDQRVE